MPNAFMSLPAPAANGSGAWTDVSSMGAQKNVVVGGADASIIIEASNEETPGYAAPLGEVQGSGTVQGSFAVRWMRATVSGYRSGTPNVDVGGSDDGCSFLELVAPAGNGVGAGADSSVLGLFKTVTVGGSWNGTVIIEISEDGTTWNQAVLFQRGGIKSFTTAAASMRVRRQGSSSGTPIVNVGADNVGPSVITIAAQGGGLDDWPRLAAAWTAMALVGGKVIPDGVSNGPLQCLSNQIIPTNAFVEFAPGSVVNMTLTPSPGFAGCPFFNVGGTVSALTTLAVASVAGDVEQTLTSAAGFSIGDYVNVRMTVGELYRYSRQIIDIVGNVVTYDRPLLRPFPSGASTEVVALVDVPRNITIIGNGTVITGTGDAIVQLISTWNAYVENFVDDTTSLTICPFNFDVASRDSKFVRCSANGKGVTPANFIIDSGENCELEDCNGRGALNLAVQFNSSDDLRLIRGTFSDGAGSGMILDVLGVGGVVGTRGLYVEATTFERFNNAGVLVQNGSSFNTFVGINSSFNTVSGFSFNSGAAVPNGNVIFGGRVQGNGQTGIAAAAGDNRSVGVDFVDNVGSQVLVSAGGTFTVNGGTVIDTSAAALLGVGNLHSTGAGSRLIVDGVQGASTRAIHHFVQVEADASVQICGFARFDSGAANQAGLLVNGTAVARVDDFTVVSAGGFGIFLNAAAAFCRMGSNVNVAACGTPILVSAGALNRGQIALTAAAPLAIAFGDTNAQDRLFWSYATNVGATGVVITGAPVVGTGFNIVGLGGDTSVINYEIR